MSEAVQDTKVHTSEPESVHDGEVQMSESSSAIAVEFVHCEPKSEKQKEGKKRQSVQNDDGTEAPKRHKRG